MIILNFAHPLTDEQLAAIALLTDQEVTEVREEPTQTRIDHSQPLARQISAMVDGLGLSPRIWQTEGILVNLPWYAPATGAVLAELSGRMGYLPTIIRLRPIAGSTPTRYEVAEIVNLQALRDAARDKRAG